MMIEVVIQLTASCACFNMLVTQSSPQASLVNLHSSEVICNSTEGSTLADFLHMRTLNFRDESDEF